MGFTYIHFLSVAILAQFAMRSWVTFFRLSFLAPLVFLDGSSVEQPSSVGCGIPMPSSQHALVLARLSDEQRRILGRDNSTDSVADRLTRARACKKRPAAVVTSYFLPSEPSGLARSRNPTQPHSATASWPRKILLCAL